MLHGTHTGSQQQPHLAQEMGAAHQTPGAAVACQVGALGV